MQPLGQVEVKGIEACVALHPLRTQSEKVMSFSTYIYVLTTHLPRNETTGYRKVDKNNE